MCLLGNSFWELPRHAAAHAQLRSACCQPGDILLWKDNTEELAWNDEDFIRFSVDCQHSELRGTAVMLKNGASTWLNMVRAWWEAAGGPRPQVEEEGAQGSNLSWGSATLKEIELVKHTVCP